MLTRVQITDPSVMENNVDIGAIQRTQATGLCRLMTVVNCLAETASLATINETSVNHRTILDRISVALGCFHCESVYTGFQTKADSII